LIVEVKIQLIVEANLVFRFTIAKE
jgi:hypothetical protein